MWLDLSPSDFLSALDQSECFVTYSYHGSVLAMKYHSTRLLSKRSVAVKGPFFSVVIPLYNKADTIVRALNSVAAQTFRDYEVIVVDDGSTDDGANVAESFVGIDNLHVVKQKNAGVSAARNRGAAEAAGKFIALLDADDVWFPRHLEYTATAVSRYPDIGLLGGGYERVEGRRLFRVRAPRKARVVDIYEAYFYAQLVHTSSMVIRRDMWIVAGGFNTSYSFYEDVEFFYRLGMMSRCCLLPYVSARYMSDAQESLTSKHVRTRKKDEWPHRSFLDNALKKGSFSRSMYKCAWLDANLMISVNILTKKVDDIEFFRTAYPHIAELYLINLGGKQNVGKRVLVYIWSNLFVIWYRVLNHSLLIRRGARHE